MPNDLFSQLRELSWRGIGLPATNFRLTLRHDLAIHKFVNRDGALVEATGRAPLEVSASIPFYNNIEPGAGESWAKGRLYPDQWKTFLAAMADRSTGVLVHPELGNIKCKPQHCDTDWSFDKRGGVPVSAAWIETVEDQDNLAALLTELSPLAAGIQAGADIDRHLSTITPPLPKTPTYEPNFQDSMRSLQGVFDQQTLLSRRITGEIDSVAYRVNALEGAIAQSARNWPIRDAIERMKSATTALRNNLLLGTRKVGIYIPAQANTLGKLAADIPAPIGDLMNLNPNLIARPVVPRGSRVRYFV